VQWSSNFRCDTCQARGLAKQSLTIEQTNRRIIFFRPDFTLYKAPDVPVLTSVSYDDVVRRKPKDFSTCLLDGTRNDKECKSADLVLTHH
jgi:hypothetical protein